MTARARKLVVAGLIIGDDGRILITQRRADQALPLQWEFPGGKVEPGEDARAALVRELREELGIEATHLSPWITRVYAYTHATVRLRFFKVSAWTGEPQPLEDQAIAWQQVERPDAAPMLPANAPVLAALALPAVMVVSDAAKIGSEAWIAKLTAAAMEERLLVQVREKELGRQPLQHLLSRALARTEPFGARVVVNSDCGDFPQASGVHLTARALLACTARPESRLVGASCHDGRELDHAAAIGVDYAVVGPVRETPTHPGVQGLGWERFAALVADRPMPCFAIGGLTRSDIAEVRRCGGHGVALRGAAFDR